MELLSYISLSLFIMGLVLIILASRIGKLLSKYHAWLGSKFNIWIIRIAGAFLICLSIITILFVILLLVAPRDYFFTMQGTVYEWVDAPSDETSEILFDNELPEGIDVKPIEKASINLYWISREDGEKTIGSSPFITIYTDSSGNFTSHNADPSPGAGNYHVKITKDGFVEASGFLLYEDGTDYEMIVLMVRKDS